MFQASVKFFRLYESRQDNICYYSGDIVTVDDVREFKKFVPNLAEVVSIKKGTETINPIKVVLYVADINVVGGIETFLFNFGKKYHDFDVTVMYRTADINQLIYLSKYSNIVRDTGAHIDCDYIIISNYDMGEVLERTTKKKAYQVFHAVVSDMAKKASVNFKKHPMVDELISVSQAAHDGLLSLTGLESTIIYNLLDNDVTTDRPLRLITLSRSAKIKGFARLVQMAKRFKENGIPFIWFVTGDAGLRQNPTYAKWLDNLPEIVVIPYSVYNKYLIDGFDYLVQLSDTEAFCYSAYEALQRGVPVIITDYEEAFRTIEDGINGYVIKMDLSNLDVFKIAHNIPRNVKYTDRFDINDWLNLLK